MNRRRTQKRKDTVNDDEERRGERRRSLFLIDGHHIISGWPDWTLGPATGKGEGRRICGATAIATPEFRGIPRLYADMRRARDGSSGAPCLPKASSARIRGLSHAMQRALSRLSRGTLRRALFSHSRSTTIAVVVAATPELLRVVIGA